MYRVYIYLVVYFGLGGRGEGGRKRLDPFVCTISPHTFVPVSAGAV